MKIIRKVALAVFKDKQLLVVRSKNNAEVFYCLGGTVEEGESDVDCLKREVQEEVGCQINNEKVEFLAEFEDWAHGKENTKVNIRMYKGELLGEPCPLAEVVEIGYFDSMVDQKHLSTIAINQMFPWLKKFGHIN